MTFHVSTITGRVGKCTATKEPCPYGGESGTEEHFATKEEAKQNQDRIMENHHGKSIPTNSRKEAYDPEKTPIETDTKLWTLYRQMETAERKLSYAISPVHHAIGDKGYASRRGRTHVMVYDKSIAQAHEELQEKVATLTQEIGGLPYEDMKTREDLDNYFALIRGKEALNKYDEAVEKLDSIVQAMEKEDKIFQKHQWSRFFMVPGGHIHESMNCSSCNKGSTPTKFGWLPSLSGKQEEQAVAEHGALLCTVCFPSAPTEWTDHYEKEEARKQAESCEGSGTTDWIEGTTRFGYYSGNGGKCSHCNNRVSATANHLIRKHKP